MEARSTKSNRSLEEARTDTLIQSASVSDLIDVGASGLADGREGVDGRDALSEEGVGRLFGFGVERVSAAPVAE